MLLLEIIWELRDYFFAFDKFFNDPDYRMMVHEKAVDVGVVLARQMVGDNSFSTIFILYFVFISVGFFSLNILSNLYFEASSDVRNIVLRYIYQSVLVMIMAFPFSAILDLAFLCAALIYNPELEMIMKTLDTL